MPMLHACLVMAFILKGKWKVRFRRQILFEMGDDRLSTANAT
jgi:hypothetical protein